MDTSTFAVASYLEKLRSSDADVRYMGLNDLTTHLEAKGASLDAVMSKNCAQAVLSALSDRNGEVQNLGVKCLGPLVKKAKPTEVRTIVERLVAADANTVDTADIRDVSTTALRAILSELDLDEPYVHCIIGFVITKLSTSLQSDVPSDRILDMLEVLNFLLGRFGPLIQKTPSLARHQSPTKDTILHFLFSNRQAICKRAIICLGALSQYLSPQLFSSLMSSVVDYMHTAKTDERLRTLIALTGQLCRSDPSLKHTKRASSHNGASQFGTYITSLEPLVERFLESPDDELKEICLTTLETFITYCPHDMEAYQKNLSSTACALIHYDPNYAMDDDMDDGSGVDVEVNMTDDSADDSLDGFDGDYSDEESMAWKVRRGTSKLMAALIVAFPDNLQEYCTSLAPILISRFSDREELVRVENMNTLKILLRKVSNTDSIADCMPSIKRRRESESDLTVQDISLVQSPLILLRALTPQLHQALSKLLNSKASLLTRNAAFELLVEFIKVSKGMMNVSFVNYMNPMKEGMEITTIANQFGGSGTTASNLKLNIMHFIKFYIQYHPAEEVMTNFIYILPLILQSVGDRFYKISSEALDIIHVIVSRLYADLQRNEKASSEILDSLLQRANASDTDQSIREKAIYTLGTAVGNICCYDCRRQEMALRTMLERLQAESTRLIAVKAIDQMANGSLIPPKEWQEQVVHDLSNFSKKSSRTLRTASLTTLAHLIQCYNVTVSDDCIVALANILSSEDGQVLPIVCLTLQQILMGHPESSSRVVAALPSIDTLINIALSQGSGRGADGILGLLSIISKIGHRSKLMKAMEAKQDLPIPLLSKALAAVIGTDDLSRQIFVDRIISKEVPEQVTTVALLTLGETARQMPLDPLLLDVFIMHFASPVEMVRNAAALALGKGIAADLETWLPSALKRAQGDADSCYLFLQAFKEALTEDINIPFAHSQSIWELAIDQKVLSADHRLQACSAELISRLVMSNPIRLISRLESELESSVPSRCKLAIQAVRFVISDESSVPDDFLTNSVSKCLSLVGSNDPETKQLVLSVLDSAARNKPDLLDNQVDNLIQLLYKEMKINDELITVVAMGPFKHKIDNGLEARKSAYDIVASLLSNTDGQIAIDELMQQLLLGLEDDHAIKLKALFLISRLANAETFYILPYVEKLSGHIEKMLAVKTDDLTIKQEFEKIAECQRAALRVVAALIPYTTQDSTPQFMKLVNDIRCGPLATNLQEAEKERELYLIPNQQSQSASSMDLS